MSKTTSSSSPSSSSSFQSCLVRMALLLLLSVPCNRGWRECYCCTTLTQWEQQVSMVHSCGPMLPTPHYCCLCLQLRVAGVQLLYNSDLVGAALGFVNELQHHSSRVWERTSDGDEPGQPHNLTERVLHSFARHDIPVDRPVSLPLVSVDMYCPGKAAFGLHILRRGGEGHDQYSPHIIACCFPTS